MLWIQGIVEILLKLDTLWIKEWDPALRTETQRRVPKSASPTVGEGSKASGALPHLHLLRDRRVGAQMKTSNSRDWFIKSEPGYTRRMAPRPWRGARK